MMRRRAILCSILCAMLGAHVGCARDETPPPAPAGQTSRPRIVSFSPAMTRIAADLGYGELIVGRTPWCTAVNESVPVVGDLNDIDYEMLVRLGPTNILIQPPQGGVPDELRTLAGERGWTVTAAHIDSVAEIRDALDVVAGAVEVRGQSQALAKERALLQFQESLDELTSGGGLDVQNDAPPLRVLLLYMTDPPAVFGAGTYLDDVLTHLGATNATEARGWAQLTLEDIARLDPPEILFIQPGAAADLDVMNALGAIADLGIAAVRERRVAIVRHPDALLPSTSVIEVAAEMRAALEGWK